MFLKATNIQGESELESTYHGFAKNALIIGGAQLATVVAGIIFLPLITKTIGADGLGIWTQVKATVSLISMAALLGMQFAFDRFLPAKTVKEDIQDGFYSAISIVFAVSLSLSLLIILFSSPIADLFFDGMTQVVKITGFIILIEALNLMFLNLFRALERMAIYAAFLIIGVLGELGLAAYLVMADYGITTVIWGMLSVRLIVFIGLMVRTVSLIGIKIPRFQVINDYLSFGTPLILDSIAGWVLRTSDRFVIIYYLGAASLGIYAAGYTLGISIISMFTQTALSVMLPRVAKLYDNGKLDEVKIYQKYVLKYLLVLAIPFVCGSAILAEPVLKLLATDEIAREGHFVVPLVAIGLLFFAANIPVQQILILRKKTRIIGATWSICALLNIGLNILLVPRIEVIGAAITTLFTYGLVLGIITFYAFKEFTFSIDWYSIMKSLIASGLMVLAVWQMSPDEAWSTIVTVILGVVTYSVFFVIIGGFEKKELTFFKEFMKGTLR